MPQNITPEIQAALNDIRESVTTQIDDLHPAMGLQFNVDMILTELGNLNTGFGGMPADLASDIITDTINKVTAIKANNTGKTEFAAVLGNLDSLVAIFKDDSSKSEAIDITTRIFSRIVQSLNSRPDVTAILGDLQAIKELKGGPADATAFHDFHVLQMAFKNTWVHAVDANLRSVAEKLYEETVRIYDDAGIPVPAFGAINDINDLKSFLRDLESSIVHKQSPAANSPRRTPRPGSMNMSSITGEPPQGVTIGPPSQVRQPSSVILSAYPEASVFWSSLDSEEQKFVTAEAAIINDSNSTTEEKNNAKDKITIIGKSALAKSGRIFNLMLELGRAINEPYAFDVFAPDSYNYGIMVTYRQKWEPLQYQAGDLVSTIPLAPGEIRKYSKRRVVKKTRTQKEIEKSMSSHSLQTSEIARAESEIMKKAITATNFKMTTHGSFNIGIGSMDSSTEFALNQSQESASNKKEFHEATIKAAEEYRLERSLEVDTSTSTETEETSSGEISNPNNEITVTYLFYELQRRYKIREFVHRARPVIMIAQDVPAPHEIDEAWLIQYQWIISRVLLDDSFREALNYLSSGFAGEEVSIAIVKAQWEKQRDIVDKLETKLDQQLTARESLREYLVQSAWQKDRNDAGWGELFMNPWDLDKLTKVKDSIGENDVIEANRKAAETRLKYTEEALDDAQNKLRQAADIFAKATDKYSASMQQQYSRHVAIDQLRVHVKQNILYYMQAIWAHEPPDQRFFRLYNKKVACSKPIHDCSPKPATLRSIIGTTPAGLGAAIAGLKFDVNVRLCMPTIGDEVDLVEIADIDNPLGYKGNYIIFPLKQHCYLTDYMLHEFVNEYYGIKDPDMHGNTSPEEYGGWLQEKLKDNTLSDDTKEIYKNDYLEYLTAGRRSVDEIIVPTGQLFIEALPGSHPLLEDFKLLHRIEDVRKVKAEVRHAELENLRLASRLVNGEMDVALLDDPDIEKKIIVEGNAGVTVDTN
jgi:hypothetical protein